MGTNSGLSLLETYGSTKVLAYSNSISDWLVYYCVIMGKHFKETVRILSFQGNLSFQFSIGVPSITLLVSITIQHTHMLLGGGGGGEGRYDHSSDF